MAGRRLLDLVAIFNATRGVTQKHIALRSRQVDVYNKTSTLARAIKNQTERVTETARAASILSSRLSEEFPPYTQDTVDDLISKLEFFSPERFAAEEKSSQEPFSADDSNSANLKIRQEAAQHSSLQDGTILTAESVGLESEPSNTPSNTHYAQRSSKSEAAKTIQGEYEFQIPSKSADGLDMREGSQLGQDHDEDVFYKASSHSSPALSSLPRTKIPKHTSNVQGELSNLHNGEINSDTYQIADTLSRLKPANPAKPAPNDEEIPEGISINVFHSPRIAKILGGGTVGGNPDKLHQQQPPDGPKISSTITTDRTQEARENSPSRAGVALNSETAFESLSSEPEGHHINLDSAEPKIDLPQSLATPYELRESRVPSSRIGRLWNYGNLAAGMFGGALSEGLRRASGSGGEGSYLLSAGNMDRLVSRLSRMRGAALKMGQMISFQDSKMIPPAIQEVLQRVQDRADYMPPSQRNKVLVSNLGSDWRSHFDEFEEKPIAAASIGQVHRATLKSSGIQVAVKIQYPGVADSIDSDLDNIAILLTASRMLPKGLFLDKTIANARTELAWECDYLREAECSRRFQELLSDETDIFKVPKVYAEASGKQVLTMEYVHGVGVTRVRNFTQEQRDWIGTQILRLCLREITEFRFMQTDPNWTNFLYNAESNKLELLDFGASREYPEDFIRNYTQLLAAASRSDKDVVRGLSLTLGYLTGHESKAMLKAHISSVLTLAEPFLATSPEVYDFKDQTITDRVKALIPVMIKERLAPPPEETYSLHRKLSGAFLLCARLESRVRCRELFQNSIEKAGINV